MGRYAVGMSVQPEKNGFSADTTLSVISLKELMKHEDIYENEGLRF